MTAKVALIMGSKSDWETMRPATEIMSELGVEHHVEVVSAHRTPDKLMEFASQAVDRGFDVIIGNPPYVRQELFKDHSEYLKKYNVYSGKADLFTYFFEKAN